MLRMCYLLLLLSLIFNLNNANNYYPWLEQMMRQEQLTTSCHHIQQIINIDDNNSNNNQINKSDMNHLLIDHKHKLLYCYVPKIACTNWKRVFMVLNGLVPSNTTNLLDIPGSLAHADNSTQRLSQINNFNDIKYYLNNYLVFLIVRHPFERLLSAYRNKFEQKSNDYFHQRYGRDIIKKYRKKNTTNINNTNNNGGGGGGNDDDDDDHVRFNEFVKYLLDNGVMENEHWMPIYNLCHPCMIDYTFIGRYETLLDDATTILNLIQINSTINFPIKKKQQQSNTNELMKYYYRQLSIAELKDLYKLYWLDFKLFGYSLEDMLGFDFAL